MKRLFLLAILTVLLVSCAGEVAIDETPITISEERSISNYPTVVNPIGGGKVFIFSNPEVDAEDDWLEISFSYDKLEDPTDPEILMCVLTDDELLYNFYSVDSRFTAITPSGSAGDAALTMDGYDEEKTGDSAGSFTLKLPKSIYGSFDFGGKPGKLFVFALEKDSSSDDTGFLAISNVLTAEF